MTEFHGENEQKKLIQTFGGEEKWQQLAKDLSLWGKKHLSPTTYDALTQTADGVIAMHQMMQQKEPALDLGSADNRQELDRQQLRNLVASPAYWRDKDPSVIQKVQNGFERLFGK